MRPGGIVPPKRHSRARRLTLTHRIAPCVSSWESTSATRAPALSSPESLGGAVSPVLANLFARRESSVSWCGRLSAFHLGQNLDGDWFIEAFTNRVDLRPTKPGSRGVAQGD